MKSKLWGVIVFLLITAVAAAPACSSEVYVAAATMNGNATYMALNPDGTFSDPEALQLSADQHFSGYSFGNGIGDFNNDGKLDYILALGNNSGDIYIFPKTGPGNQFDIPVWAGSWARRRLPCRYRRSRFQWRRKPGLCVELLPQSRLRTVSGRRRLLVSPSLYCQTPIP